MQHIGVQRERENGEVIASFDEAGIDLRIVANASTTSACLRFIDPYGDLVVNQRQLPVLVSELETMSNASRDAGLKQNIGNLVAFLRASEGTHVYVRFVGD